MPLTVMLAGSGADALAEQLRSIGRRTITGSMADVAALVARTPSGGAVLVLDVRDCTRLPDLQPLRQAHPAIGMVMVAAALDPALMLDAMRAGISECVAEPLSPAVLDAAIRRVAGRTAPGVVNESRVIGILGAKGGVGATTLAVNVATALARVEPAGTLLIDLHAEYGDATLFLGVEPRFSILDAIKNVHRLDEPLFRTLVVATRERPDVLAAPSAAPSTAPDPAALRDVVEFASHLYRFVVLDCPRATGALQALDDASSIGIVTSQELTSIRNTAELASALEQRGGRGRIHVIVNRLDDAADIAPRDVEQTIGRRVAHVLPSDYRQCLEALNKGRPLVLAGSGKLAGSMTKMAHQLADVREQSGTVTRGLFERFTNRPLNATGGVR